MEKKKTSENKYIAPMILLPFIENAFKYGTHHTEKKLSIKINISISKNNPSHLVRNLIKKRHTYIEKGIGIKNTTQRLELIYPGQHSINIDNNGNEFFVNMEINNLYND